MQSRVRLCRLALITLAVLLLLILSACDASRPQSTFGTSGPIAKEQLELFWLIFGMAMVIFVLVEGALLYIIIRFRRRPTDQTLPPQIHGNTKLEIAWTIVPALLLVIVAVPTYQTIAKHDAPPPGATVLKVDVYAHQWWWEFRYPELGVVTANELHIPLDTAIDLTLNSRDVIHSFWVPKLAGKTDIVPANTNTMWFEASEPGDYYGHCAEFCGVAHAQMRFRVIAEDQYTFDAWVAKQDAPPKPPVGDLALQGQQLFATKGCVVCHTINGPETEATQDARAAGFQQGGAIFAAPNLTTFGDRGMMAGGLVPRNEQNLLKWVRNPDDIKPGNRMSELAAAYQGVSMSDVDVDALVAYLLDRTTDASAASIPVPTAAALGAGTATPPGEIPGGLVALTTHTKDLAFDAERMAVRAGAQVTLDLANDEGVAVLQHNWVLVKAGTEDAVVNAGLEAGPSDGYLARNDPNVLAHIPLVDGGKSGSVTFSAPVAGIYAYICSFPGHAAAGMRGVFEVVP